MERRLTASNLGLADLIEDENSAPYSITINVKGEETLWEYRELSWYEKNKCVTKATTFTIGENGETLLGFDVSAYYLESLNLMLVSGPIPITPNTLKKLKGEVGQALQSIVPAPLSSPEVVDAAKKDLAISSEEQSQTKEI